jgi:ubiquinone/menaquinone biosynthesis C-methylase UbiE
MAANYDNSAWFYDRLSKLVYGQALIEAKQYLAAFVPADSKILIAGGGTGYMLELLTKQHPLGLTISYAEVSKKMLTIAQKRNTGQNQVIFYNEAVEEILFSEAFDVAITPFLFDNFSEETLHRVFLHLDKSLKPGGLWLNVDFQLTGKWWQNLLLSTMFTFFRIICQIEASALPEIHQSFQTKNYLMKNSQTFFGDFILAEVYQKNGAQRNSGQPFDLFDR